VSIVNSIGSLTTPPRGRRRRRRSRRRRSKSQRVHFTLIGGQLFSVSFCFQFVIDLLLSFLLLLLLLLLILLILLLLLLLLYFVSLFPGNPKYVGGSLAKEPEEVERFSISHFGFGLVWFSFFLWVFFCSQVEMIIYNNHQGRWNRFGTKKKKKAIVKFIGRVLHLNPSNWNGNWKQNGFLWCTFLLRSLTLLTSLMYPIAVIACFLMNLTYVTGQSIHCTMNY